MIHYLSTLLKSFFIIQILTSFFLVIGWDDEERECENCEETKEEKGVPTGALMFLFFFYDALDIVNFDKFSWGSGIFYSVRDKLKLKLNNPQF